MRPPLNSRSAPAGADAPEAKDPPKHEGDPEPE